jgi:hypothetical protein
MFGVTALKQEMEAGVFVAMFRPLPHSGITDLSNGKAGHLAPRQDFSVKELGCLWLFTFSPRRSPLKRLPLVLQYSTLGS